MQDGPDGDDSPCLTRVTLSGAASIRCLDLFFFNDDVLGRLDAYQRLEGFSASLTGASRSGKKRLVVLANAAGGTEDWLDITAYGGLLDRSFDLEQDSPSQPVMAAEGLLAAGSDKQCRLVLTPLMAQVRLRSLSCDFYGHPYEGCALEDAKVYLTNVCSRCEILPRDGTRPGGFLNVGRLSEEDLQKMLHPEMVYRDLGRAVGKGVVYPGVSLYCYPNQAPEEGPGSPFTRLVIEGTIEGETYYYPIDIGRNDAAGGPEGIARGMGYAFDITLTRKGSRDPDIPVETGSFRLNITSEPWTEKQERVIPL